MGVENQHRQTCWRIFLRIEDIRWKKSISLSMASVRPPEYWLHTSHVLEVVDGDESGEAAAATTVETSTCAGAVSEYAMLSMSSK